MDTLRAVGSYIWDPVDPHDPAKAWRSYWNEPRNPKKLNEAMEVTRRFVRQAPVGMPM